MPNSSICVDASLVVRLVIDPSDQQVRARWEAWATDGLRPAAPALLYFEVANAIYQYRRQGLISEAASHVALDAALSLPIDLHQGDHLHRWALRLAERHSLPATYDAHYLALAELLGVEFWTADGRLARTVGTKLPWVRLVA